MMELVRAPVGCPITHPAKGQGVTLCRYLYEQDLTDGYIPRCRVFSGRLQSATGWQPEIPIEQTLADLLDDMRQRISVER